MKCNFPGGVFLALSHGCRRRGRNYVPIRGGCKKICICIFFIADCNEYCADLQNSENMDIGYDYEKCIGLKVKPRKGDGLLFYSLMVNGTIDRVRAGLSKWPCTCVSRSLSCTRSRTHVRSFSLIYITSVHKYKVFSLCTCIFIFVNGGSKFFYLRGRR